MPAFFERNNDNQSIDELVRIANEGKGDHSLEGLFVPPREEMDDFINDSSTEDNREPQLINFSSSQEQQPFSSATVFTTGCAVIAVDAGVVDLGELSSGGTVFAIRGAAVCYPANGRPFICRYNTGAIVIDHDNRFPVFHYIGLRLGKEELFVDIDKSTKPHSYKAKAEDINSTPNQIRDRCRNFFERMIQEEAISILESYGGGILLIDGALSGGTFDTPETYIRDLLKESRNRNISAVAISKKTRVTIGGRPISSLFMDAPEFIGYAQLDSFIAEERSDDSRRSAVSVAEAVYAVRFSYAPLGLTFRVDVNSAKGLIAGEVLDNVFSSCRIYGGYPRPLIEAHQYSSFLYQDVQTLLADVIVRLGVRPHEQPSMEVLFQPFGARYK
ncbi:MAG: DNA double-strand break repair nuclease NurA [Pyrinomonadaceae bacterium MAG19_C2-C3]|nr:DNA double-strand break repair nuclease NurA [Pyrinomonadaceae bacterium MAG19_C2-C3]